MAHTLIPISIVVGLGAVSALAYHLRYIRYWPATFLVALTAGVIWMFGTLVFLKIAAPSEAWQGWRDLPYALGAFVVTSLVALLPAMLVGCAVRRARGTTVGKNGAR